MFCSIEFDNISDIIIYIYILLINYSLQLYSTLYVLGPNYF